MSSLLVSMGTSSCENKAKTEACEGAEVRTILQGGDLMALMCEVGLHGAGGPFTLISRSTVMNSNGSKSEILAASSCGIHSGWWPRGLPHEHCQRVEKVS